MQASATFPASRTLPKAAEQQWKLQLNMFREIPLLPLVMARVLSIKIERETRVVHRPSPPSPPVAAGRPPVYRWLECRSSRISNAKRPAPYLSYLDFTMVRRTMPFSPDAVTIFCETVLEHGGRRSVLLRSYGRYVPFLYLYLLDVCTRGSN